MEKRLGNIFGFTGGNYAGNVYDQNYIAPTLNNMQGGYRQPMIIEVVRMGGLYADREARVYEDVAPILRSERIGLKTMENQYRIRKLTPKECWRLMGFTDEDFHKAEAVNSNTQLYKQAGNSIVVPVLEAIFRQMGGD